MKTGFGQRLLGSVAATTLPFALMIPSQARAQDGVTLYGILGSSLAYFNHAADGTGQNGGSLFKFLSGAGSSVRWGLKGSEALGAGVNAVFTLENGFNMGTGATGQGSRMFGRQASVGVSSARWGTLTAGRQYDPTVEAVSKLTENGVFPGFSSPGDVDNYNAGGLRVSNSLKYASPLVAGFRVSALYGMGGVAGAAGSAQSYGFGISYKLSPIELGAGYFHANGGNTTSSGRRVWGGTADSLFSFFSSPITAGFATARSIEIARVAAQYRLGHATLGVAYSHSQYTSDALSSFAGNANFNHWSTYWDQRFTATTHAAIGCNYTTLTSPTSAHYLQFNLAIGYLLSKRTDVFASAAYQKASGSTLDASGHVVDAHASIGDLSVDAGARTQALFMAGMRHRF